MKTVIPAGSTSQIRHVYLQDVTGAAKTGILFSNITAYYVRTGGTLTALTMETIATLGTWGVSGDNKLGLKLLHDTNAPGLYELHLPNNILAAGADAVTILLRATGVAPCRAEIQLASVGSDLRTVDGQDASATAAVDFDKLTAIIGSRQWIGPAEPTGGSVTWHDTPPGTFGLYNSALVQVQAYRIIPDSGGQRVYSTVYSFNGQDCVFGAFHADVSWDAVNDADGYIVRFYSNVGFEGWWDTANTALAIYGNETTETLSFGGETVLTVTGKLDDVLVDTGTTIPNAISALPAPLDAAGTRTALGLDAADLDDQLTIIAADVGGLDGATPASIATAVWAATTRTLTSLSSLVASIATAVWAAATRTLTGTGNGTGPRASLAVTRIAAKVLRDTTRPLVASVVLSDGTYLGTGDVASATMTIYEVDEHDASDWTVLDDYDGVDVTDEIDVLDPPQTDALAANYNFRHRPAEGAFTAAGRRYIVQYELVLSGEQDSPVWVGFALDCV